MPITEQIPSLSDEALQNLHENAIRLAQSGNDKQRAQAEDLLPHIGAALDERRAAQRLKDDEKRAGASKKKAAAARATRVNAEH